LQEFYFKLTFDLQDSYVLPRELLTNNQQCSCNRWRGTTEPGVRYCERQAEVERGYNWRMRDWR